MRRAGLVLLLLLAGCGGSGAGELGLQLDDFPSGWREYNAGGDDSTCESLVAARQAAEDYGRSKQFEHQDGVLATTSVFLYQDEAAARKGFKTLTSDATLKCLAEAIKGGNPTRSDLAAGGDEHAAVRATVPATRSHPAGIFDLVFVRTGSGVAELVFAGVRDPFDPKLRAQLTAKVVERLKARRP